MRSNLLDEYLKILFRYTLALIFAMFIKVVMIDIVLANTEDNIIVFSPENKSKLEYKEEAVNVKWTEELDENNLKKPFFEMTLLDEYVDDYIENNKCEQLEYRVTELEEGKINLFLNCGKPDNLVFNYREQKKETFKSLVRDYDEFLNISKRLLNLKYPTFVTDNIDFDRAVYDIKQNEIMGFYETSEFGNVAVRINNNEIRDLMTYEMSYDDAYENEVFTLDPNKKTIAFTFDDGPSTYDLQIIDALVASHSTATFYMVGNRMRNYPASIQKMVDTKMEMGNHTYDHKSLTGLGDDQIKEEITKTNNIFYEMTGRNLTSLRPSYGNVNKKVSVQVGMPIVLWSIDTLDWKYRNADKVYDVILEESTDGDIVLMHSLYESTVQAVKKVLPELYKRGFQVVSVEELAKLKGKTLTAGASIWDIK